jgi:hypothetical protein
LSNLAPDLQPTGQAPASGRGGRGGGRGGQPPVAQKQ